MDSFCKCGRQERYDFPKLKSVLREQDKHTCRIYFGKNLPIEKTKSRRFRGPSKYAIKEGLSKSLYGSNV
jgi:hypothetical protein